VWVEAWSHPPATPDRAPGRQPLGWREKKAVLRILFWHPRLRGAQPRCPVADRATNWCAVAEPADRRGGEAPPFFHQLSKHAPGARLPVFTPQRIRREQSCSSTACPWRDTSRGVTFGQMLLQRAQRAALELAGTTARCCRAGAGPPDFRSLLEATPKQALASWPWKRLNTGRCYWRSG